MDIEQKIEDLTQDINTFTSYRDSNNLPSDKLDRLNKSIRRKKLERETLILKFQLLKGLENRLN